MNKEILNYIIALSKKIKYHDQKYHEQDNPEITDNDYDEICKKYDQLIQQHPEFIYLERKLIGSSPSIQFDKYTHKKPMGSLVNGFTIKDIEDFINRTNKFLSLKNNMPLEFMCEPKIDGLSISLSYHNGILLNGVTRGDGTTGEIVTNNIKTISDIPHKLKKEYPEFIEVRGEIFMSKNNFNILNSTQEAKGKNIFANPRNAAAGSIRQKDIKILNERKLNFNAFSVGEFSNDFKFETQSDLLKKLNHMGFLISIENIQVNNLDQIQKFYTKMLNKRNSLDYEIDGLVYKVNSKEYQDRLGN
jgi:DNA ligase (NAD+)